MELALHYQLLTVLFVIHIVVRTVDCQLQELCKEVYHTVPFAHADLDCTDVDFTVKLNLKYASLNDIDGVRMDLLCNNGTVIITVKQYYSLQRTDETFNYLFESFTSATIDDCTLFTCYSTTKYGSYMIETNSTGCINNLPIQTVHNGFNTTSLSQTSKPFPTSSIESLLASLPITAIITATSTDVYRSLLPSTVTVAMITDSTAVHTDSSTTISRTTRSVLAQTNEITDASSLASSRHYFTAQTKLFQHSFSSFTSSQKVLSSSITTTTPHADANFHNTKTSGTQLKTSPSYRLQETIKDSRQLESTLSPSFPPFSSTVLAISTASSILAVCFVVLIALVSCLLFLMKHYKFDNNQTNEIVEDAEIMNELQMSIQIDKEGLEILKLSPSMVTVLSPLNKLEQISCNEIDIEQQSQPIIKCSSCPVKKIFHYGDPGNNIPPANDIADTTITIDYRETSSCSPITDTSELCDISTEKIPQQPVVQPEPMNPTEIVDIENTHSNKAPLQSSELNEENEVEDWNEDDVNGTSNSSAKSCKFCSDQKTYLHCYHSFVD